MADEPRGLVSNGVIPDHGGEGGPAAKGDDVPRHIADGAQHHVLGPAGHHRHRRLGGDARDLAMHEAVDHQVAYAGDADAGQGAQQGLEFGQVHDVRVSSLPRRASSRQARLGQGVEG